MNEQRDEPGRRPRLNLTTSQVAASALAACCASIVASYLGVAGTVIGAAVGSVVATTGAAVYAQLFRHGGARIRRTLLVNGRAPEDPADLGRAPGAPADDPGAAGPAAVRAGRFYSAGSAAAAPGEARPAEPGASGTAKFWLPASSAVEQTRVTVGEPTVIAGAARGADPTVLAAGGGRGREDGGPENDAPDPARPRRAGAATAIRRYRKPIGVLASIVAVFCVSISVGFLLGGPVRTVGSHSAPPVNTTTQTRHPRGAGGGRFADPDPSTPSSPTTSATPGTTPSPSADGTATNPPSASQPASAGASGTSTGTSTGNGTGAAGAPTRQPLGGTAAATSKPTPKAP